MKKGKLMAFMVTLLSIFGIILTASATNNVQTVDAQTKEKYVIATDTTFAPFEFINEAGEMVGIDMDILAAIAENQGFEYEVRALGFNAAVQALESKQVDGVIAGMSITPEREKVFTFSEAYYHSSLSFAVKADSDIQTLDDLKGQRIAVKTGTQGAELAESLREEYDFEIVTFEDSVNMYQEVMVGNSAAAVEDFPVMAYAINDGKLALRQLEETFDIGSYGFATSPGENPDLVAAFNEGLANIQASGQYDEILATYLGDAEVADDASNIAQEEELTHDKKYVIATDTTFAPFEFVNEAGEMVGIDMDILAAIAEDQGFEYEVRALGFNAAVQALESKQVDGVIAGMSITPERQEAFDFSEAYYNSSLSFAVKADSDVQTLDDLKGQRIAVKTGTQGSELAESLREEYDFEIVTFEDSVNMYQEVMVGNSAAAVEDFPVMAYAINDGKLALRQLEETFDIGSYGFATSPGENPDLVAAFNEGLANIQASGQYDEILATYLGDAEVADDASNIAQEEELTHDKKYVIATDTTFAPFEFVNETGEMVGIDMDILAAIAEDQGFDYEVRALGFNAAVQALESKQVDGVIAGMSITPEREKAFTFSEAYYLSSLSFAVKADSEIQTLDDLKGQRIAVKTGTQGAELAESLREEYDFEIVTFEDSVNMYQEVMVGNSAAAVEDFPVMAYAINDGKLALRQLEETFDIGSYGFATSPGENPDLVAAFNEGLANIQASGEYDEILATYLGNAEVVDDATNLAQEEEEEEVTHDKKYVIATDTTFAPFEFVNEAGEMVGIDMDILAAIAEDQGFEYEVRALGFNAAVQALESKQVDGVIAGMSITPERQEAFDFSEAYYLSSLSFAVKADSEIQTLDDLKGQRIAVKTGTQGAELAESLREEYDFEIVTFEDSVNMYQEVMVGNSAAAVEDFPVMAYAINDGNLDLRQLEETFDIGSYGFATSPGENPDLVTAFNRGLANIQASGQYDEILATYLGSDSAEALEHDKTYIIATDQTYAPFEFVDDDGNLVGIDMDLMAAIAEDQGFDYEMKVLGFNAAVQALESGQADGVIAGMSITDARKESFDFSEPYFDSQLSFAVKADSEIQTLADLEGLRVAVKTGTQGADLADSLKEEYGFEIAIFEDSANVIEDVLAGNSAALVEDHPVMAYTIKEGDVALRLLDETFTVGSYGFAVMKGENADLLTAFNQGLANLRESGAYDEILATYTSTDGATESVANDALATEEADEEAANVFISQITKNWRPLLNGLWTTVWVTLVSILIAMIIGIALGIMSAGQNPVLKFIALLYVDIMRGIPLLVLSFFIYFGVPQLTGLTFPATLAGIVTLSLNAAAYISEIVRGGIKAVPIGQSEAGRSLGLPYNQTLRHIVLPQAFKIMVPSFINQFVITLKDTSILSVIGLVELTQTGKIIIARDFQSGSMWLIVGLMYIIIITALTRVSKRLEKEN